MGKVSYYILFTFLLITAGLTALSTLDIPGNYKIFVVQSGSMEPKIKTGSVVLIAPQDGYYKDDVITFLREPDTSIKDHDSTVTHRIVEVKNEEGVISYITKGDANNAPDNREVPKHSVLGKMLFAIPFV